MAKEKVVKVKARGPYKVKNKVFSYEFDAGKEYEIPEKHLNVLVEAGVVEELK
jgi:hypothetical protein